MNKVEAKNQIRQNRILRTLLEHGEVSMTDLSRLTGMTIPMVIKQIDILRGNELVQDELGRFADKVGRPPIVARLNGGAGCVLGIDIGHRNTNYVLLNLQQAIIAELHRPSPDIAHTPLLVEELTEGVEDILHAGEQPRSKLLGIGISIPGIVRGREGRSETYLNFGSQAVRDVLQEQWKTPILVEHDAKAMALGEFWFGAARNKCNVLCINVGWGLGLGIILNGKIYYGRDGYAGEFGHIVMQGNERSCQCGKRGCLETVASGRAIAQRAAERIAQGHPSLLAARHDMPIEAEQVIHAAMVGDQCSLEVLGEAGRMLGEGIAVLIDLLNPEMVILGGRVAGAGEFLLNPLKDVVSQRALAPLGKNVEFRVSSLGANAGALGVAMLATRDIFEIDHLNPVSLV